MGQHADTETERFARLVGMIYDSALDPAHWEATLAEIRLELDFCNAMFTVWTVPQGHTVLNVMSGIAPDFAESFVRHGEDVVRQWGGPAAIAGFPVGEPQVLSRVSDAADWGRSAFHREWVAPQGIADMMAMAVTRDGRTYCSVGFARHSAAGEIGEREIALVRLLAPHFQRAVTISRILDVASVTASTFRSVVDALPSPVLVVGDGLDLIHANPAGATLLQRRDTLLTEADRIVLPSPALESLRAAVSGGRLAASIPLATASGPVVLHVLPLQHGRLRAGLMPSATAAVFVAAASAAPAPTEALAALFDLTPAETRVLAALAAGRTLAETAEVLGVGLGTARTHLLRLFAKTGTNRQAELIRLADMLALPA